MDANARHCPHCQADLRAGEIPKEYIEKGYYDAMDPYYYRTIGVEVRFTYDGVLYWMCPDCGGRWHRWPNHDYRWALALKHSVEEGFDILDVG